MNKSSFIKKLDHAVIESAIARAEAMTSGEIRVVVMQEPTSNAVATAQEIFVNRGMAKTRDRNAVLILVAPTSQTFAVIGDEGVHQKCDGDFWEQLAAAMQENFARGDFTQGVQEAITRAGDLLSRHFPRKPDDRDELPNQVMEA